MKLTQQHIKKHPEKLVRFDRVRIWSGEWHMWWRCSAQGYTADMDEAGVFDAYDAWERVAHCGPEKKISLVAA
ncbi:hypothetical protein LCL99_03100 [Halomonas denitrificans]|uniref:hypothetical protein n=1 Tax=Halomonas denitrificans TaxID=370769 RepID=UPI001CD79A14|nr:hypothetical protein [Halomonas denitrificans]MCA0973452.1 hypothetical protein [Halomonas denitrificans]MED5295925.1 hypothetical protein [Pseudomonadota bacterium]